MVSATAAIVVANTFPDSYQAIVHAHGTLGPIPLDLHIIVNDILMAVFFTIVGLEIKREFISGELSQMRSASLPIVAAIGGMIAPALFYFLATISEPNLYRGWAIPCATDIAFSLGILSLFGRRIPPALKVFLTGLAIIDDLLAVAIIALFYSESLSPLYLAASGVCLLILACFHQKKINFLFPYLCVAPLFLWAVFYSGVHATIAGVLFALCIPHSSSKDSLLIRLEHALHPWVAYAVLPIFAFVNAGVLLPGVTLGHFLEPVALGIAAGLFFGKQIGVMGSSFLAMRFGYCILPQGTNWVLFYGVSILTGIGFTMSLFIGGLSFQEEALIRQVKLGVISGSLISALVGMLVIARGLQRNHNATRIGANLD